MIKFEEKEGDKECLFFRLMFFMEKEREENSESFFRELKNAMRARGKGVFRFFCFSSGDDFFFFVFSEKVSGATVAKKERKKKKEGGHSFFLLLSFSLSLSLPIFFRFARRPFPRSFSLRQDAVSSASRRRSWGRWRRRRQGALMDDVSFFSS